MGIMLRDIVRRILLICSVFCPCTVIAQSAFATPSPDEVYRQVLSAGETLIVHRTPVESSVSLKEIKSDPSMGKIFGVYSISVEMVSENGGHAPLASILDIETAPFGGFDVIQAAKDDSSIALVITKGASLYAWRIGIAGIIQNAITPLRDWETLELLKKRDRHNVAAVLSPLKSGRWRIQVTDSGTGPSARFEQDGVDWRFLLVDPWRPYFAAWSGGKVTPPKDITVITIFNAQGRWLRIDAKGGGEISSERGGTSSTGIPPGTFRFEELISQLYDSSPSKVSDDGQFCSVAFSGLGEPVASGHLLSSAAAEHLFDVARAAPLANAAKLVP